MSACAQPAPRVISNVSLVSGFSIVHNCLISLPLFWPFFDFSSSRSHFWPFTEVVRKMPGEVTRKCAGDTNCYLSGLGSAGGVRRTALRS
jgi:hypothetical protein